MEDEDKGKKKKTPPEAGLVEMFVSSMDYPRPITRWGTTHLMSSTKKAIDHRCSILEPVCTTFEGHVPSATQNQFIYFYNLLYQIYVVVSVIVLLVWHPGRGLKGNTFFQKGVKKTDKKRP